MKGERYRTWIAGVVGVAVPAAAAAILLIPRDRVDTTNVALILVVVLLVVGISVSELAVRGRRRAAAARYRRDIERIHAVAELIADGEGVDFVLIAVAHHLRDLLTLTDVRFERVSFGDERPVPVLDRSGRVVVGRFEWRAELMGLPTTVALYVDGDGRRWGRFLLTPTLGVPLPLEHRMVAVALADQAGAACSSSPRSTSR